MMALGVLLLIGPSLMVLLGVAFRAWIINKQSEAQHEPADKPYPPDPPDPIVIGEPEEPMAQTTSSGWMFNNSFPLTSFASITGSNWSTSRISYLTGNGGGLTAGDLAVSGGISDTETPQEPQVVEEKPPEPVEPLLSRYDFMRDRPLV